MISKKKVTRNQLLIWIVSLLALIPQASFSKMELDSRSDTNAITEKSVSEDIQPVPTRLYTIKLHHKNKNTGEKKSSQILVYATFERNKYVVVCQSEADQYQDASEKCEALKNDVNLGKLIKIAEYGRNAKDFKASEFRDQNIFLRIISYFSGYYSVDFSSIFP